jgi:hypothetical protein
VPCRPHRSCTPLGWECVKRSCILQIPSTCTVGPGAHPLQVLGWSPPDAGSRPQAMSLKDVTSPLEALSNTMLAVTVLREDGSDLHPGCGKRESSTQDSALARSSGAGRALQSLILGWSTKDSKRSVPPPTLSIPGTGNHRLRSRGRGHHHVYSTDPSLSQRQVTMSSSAEMPTQSQSGDDPACLSQPLGLWADDLIWESKLTHVHLVSL